MAKSPDDEHMEELEAEIASLKEQLETERMRLAACGVAALGYFDGCRDEYRSASLEDILKLYKENQGLKVQLAECKKDAGLLESQARKIAELKDIIQRPDRKELQAEGKHPAPCAKFCEAAAFCIEIRNLNAEIETVRAELQLAWNTCGDAEKVRDQLRAALVEIKEKIVIGMYAISGKEAGYIYIKAALTRCKEVLK